MKYTAFDLNKPVLNMDGSEAKMRKGDTDQPFTVKDAFRVALNGVYADELPTQQRPEGLSLKTKMERYELSKKIWNCEESIELKTEELNELKVCINKMFQTPEICGFLENVIERPSSQNG